MNEERKKEWKKERRTDTEIEGKKDWKLRIKEEGGKRKNVKGWWSNNDEVYCDNYSWVRFDEMFTIYKFCWSKTWCDIYFGVMLDVIFTPE